MCMVDRCLNDVNRCVFATHSIDMEVGFCQILQKATYQTSEAPAAS